MKYPQFWLKASPRRKRGYSIFAVFILSLMVTLIGALVPVSPETAQIISNQLNQTVTEGQAQGTLNLDIFVNNFSLCLLMFIPIAGFFIGMFILFSTGQAFRAVFEVQMASGAATATPDVSIATTTIVLVLIGVAAVFLLEFITYAIGMTESLWMFRRILQNKWKRELKWFIIFIGIAALLLVIGAIVETATISLQL
ncbi:hypothetical protein [Candidatus Bathycorpusculum sp.]|uniref:hypothetical protein n=1 Tax=Candidatus Bathycorpusculum sp. TaxID=2994959 RepID=UPI002823F596|nr:stage II sporulation protein M [Candidatus Termitimicrobium sp.]